jgi:hypothetical protein
LNRLALLLALSIGWAAAAPGRAAMITGVPQGNDPVDSPDKKFRVSLTPRPVTHLNAISADDFKLLTKAYPNWTFTSDTGKDKPAQAPGTFNVLQYTGFAIADRGGADFSALYDNGNPVARKDYDWVQIGHPTNFGSKGSTPFVDSLVAGSPFYDGLDPATLPRAQTATAYFGPSVWLNKDGKYPQQSIQNPAGGGSVPTNGDLLLVDEPFVTYNQVPQGQHSSLVLDAFLVTFTWNGKSGADSGGTVTLFDGMEYGVDVVGVPAGGDGGGASPQPEPATFVLGLIGGAALIAARVRQARASSRRTAGRVIAAPSPAPTARPADLRATHIEPPARTSWLACQA